MGNTGFTVENTGVAEKHLVVTVGRTVETIDVDLILLVATLNSLLEVRCMLVSVMSCSVHEAA